MNRPVGITIAAVVQILGSLLCLLFAPVMMWSTRQPDAPAGLGGAAMIGAAVYAAFGAVGIATAVGLVRMRPWARVSTLVFAGFMALVSVTAALGLFFVRDFVPPPAAGGAASPRVIALTAAAFFSVPFCIAAWWLIYFTRASVRDAFAAASDAAPSARPLSISIIGWLYVVSSVGSIVPAALGLPAYVFGAILTGWTATVAYVVMGAIGGSLGWGLLQLREQARLLMLGWLGVTAAHMAFMALVPGQFARIQAAMPRAYEPQPQFAPGGAFMAVMLLPSIGLLALAAWFLVKEKAAFTRESAATN